MEIQRLEKMRLRTLPVITLLGVPLNNITEAQSVQCINEELAFGRGGWMVTVNLDHLRRLVNDSSYSALCKGADLMVADGMPLVWAARLQGTALPERIAGSDLISRLSVAAAANGRTVFLLGGDLGTAEFAAEALKRIAPTLKITGTYCPQVGFEQDNDIFLEIEKKLLAAKPDIVYVALGSPKQEEMINRLRSKLPGTWWMGVGISFSYLAGDISRAPRWVQNIGLEWLVRLLQEPGRLFNRYIIHGLPFACVLLTRSLIAGLQRKKRAL